MSESLKYIKIENPFQSTSNDPLNRFNKYSNGFHNLNRQSRMKLSICSIPYAKLNPDKENFILCFP